MTSDNVLPYGDIYPKLEANVFIAPGAWVVGDVVIGKDSSIWFNTVVRGDEHYVRIGSRTNVQDNCTLHVTGGRFPLEIGSRITIGHRAIVHGCVVEDDCLIGMGAIIMDGARIGRGSLVAAGSVVTPGTIVPPDSVVMGAPASVRKQAGETEHTLIRESVLHYIELARNHSNPHAAGDEKRVRGFLG
jgi:carbonic anhydrase/acetyltransferase-like protein (isoleucine patch superfamily)